MIFVEDVKACAVLATVGTGSSGHNKIIMDKPYSPANRSKWPARQFRYFLEE